MVDLQVRFVRFVRARRLVRAGDRVLVALSGGVDSVVLLHLFRASADQLKISVQAAHFDHAMRADSEADADWVSGLCQAWELPLSRARTDRPLYGETDARNERYRFLYDAARASGSERVATAHHADDQVETVLFRLLRGTGLRGLAGIPVRRGRIIRPLLRFTKDEILAYAATHALSFRSDATNEQLGYARNRIRKTVIPALETVRPHARSAVLGLAHYAARTEAAWHSALASLEKDVILSTSATLSELARPVLLEYHPELRARLLRQMLRRHGFVPGRAQTKHLVQFCERAESGTSLQIAGAVRLERAFDTIRVVRSEPQLAAAQGLALVGPAGSASFELGGRRYRVDWNTDDVRREGAVQLDAALSDARLELRAWRAGDRIRLPYGTKKLKKLFLERRVPASERTQTPVLSDEHGRVLWVVGVARSIDALPAGTGPALNITVRNAELR
jgi:tRNA(Ile)-lysidine synthase